MNGLFFNIDLIAYLGYELKDIKSTKADLDFLCKEIQPPSIIIHHLCRMKKTKESIENLFKIIKETCNKYDYVCININLDETDFNITISKNMIKRISELIIIKRDKLNEYIPTYMTNQINSQYAYGYNLLAIGNPKIKQFHSSSGDILYYEHNNVMFIQNDKNDMDYNNFIHLVNIYAAKNLKFALK